MSKVVAGIDVSKSSLDVHAAGKERCFANDSTSWRALDKWLRDLDVSRVVIEALAAITAEFTKVFTTGALRLS